MGKSSPPSCKLLTSYSVPYPIISTSCPPTLHAHAYAPKCNMAESTACLYSPDTRENRALSFPYAWDFANTSGVKCCANAGGGSVFEYSGYCRMLRGVHVSSYSFVKTEWLTHMRYDSNRQTVHENACTYVFQSNCSTATNASCCWITFNCA